MNRRELAETLEAEGFDPRCYSLSGVDIDNALCLACEGGNWVVYFAERGSRFDEEWFVSESDACKALLERFRGLPEGEGKRSG